MGREGMGGKRGRERQEGKGKDEKGRGIKGGERGDWPTNPSLLPAPLTGRVQSCSEEGHRIPPVTDKAPGGG